MGAPNGAFLLFRRDTPGVGPWVSSVFVIDTSYVFCNNKTFPQNGGMLFGGKASWGFSSSNSNSMYICTYPWNQNPLSPMEYSNPLQMLCPRMMCRHWGTDCTRMFRLTKNHNIPPHNDMNMWFCMWCCRNMNGLPFFDIPCPQPTMTCRFYNLKWYR